MPSQDRLPPQIHQEAHITLAYSLTGHQAQLARTQQSGASLELGGLARVYAILHDPNGEILLLGAAEPDVPPLTVEALVIALRNAYQDSPLVSADFKGVLGCTIDPWEGQADPWQIQKTQVFGMPRTTSMGARHVFVDYHFKKVNVGFQRLGHVHSMWTLWRDQELLCDASARAAQTEMSHRYWFTARYPEAPRFEQEGGLLFIRKPVGVQVMTEQMLWDNTGRRTGAILADPLAEQYAAMVTDALATNDLPPEYLQLRQDFRLIEVAKLVQFLRIPAQQLAYLLRDFPLTAHDTPRYVTGIYREERSSMVCEGEIQEEVIPSGIQVRSQADQLNSHAISRGGVEAKVAVTRDQLAEQAAGTFDQLRARVYESRPSAQALHWVVTD